MKSMKETFDYIYDNDKWGGGRCKSGGGSLLGATVEIRKFLKDFLRMANIKILTDAPCGVSEWILECTVHLDYYFGFDIVESAIIDRIKKNKRMNHFFQVADISTDIMPVSDAILCRDCLVHMPNEFVSLALKNFRKTGSRFLIATTFPNAEKNQDIPIGSWRALNLCGHPFNLPQPLYLIRENESAEKHIGVWYMADIPYF